MSLLTGEPRSASVIAYTECQVLEVDKKSLEPLLMRRPDLARQIAEIMAERKLKSELMTAETKKVSVGDRLRDYSEAFAKSI
jgi:CRP-like cAMP-binding protein